MNGEPHKVTATLKVVVTGEFYGEVSEESLRYFVEQAVEDDGFDVDVELLKEQEPKTGKWILDDDDANSWECSACGGLLVINDGTPHENDWHFCPYCGAKLDKQAVKFDE